MSVNKIKLGNTTLIDLTNATVLASDIQPGKTAYDKNGDLITGTSTKNADTHDDTVQASWVRSGKTFHNNQGAADTGTMEWIDTSTDIELGAEMPGAATPAFYNGVTFSLDESVIKAENIANNVTILGVTGTYAGTETVETGKYIQASTYTGSGARYDTISPTSPNTAFRDVKVGKIWYTESATSGTTGTTLDIVSLTQT